MTETISLAFEPTRTTELVNGLTMTVTAAANSTGKLFHVDSQSGAVLETFAIAASQTMRFGPFPTIRKYRLECDSGSLSYTFDKKDFDYGTQLGNIESFVGARALTFSDNGKLLRCDDISNVVVTVPKFLPEGFNLAFAMWNTGTVTLTAGSGATARDTKAGVATQYKVGSLLVVKNADGASAEYLLGGDAA